MLKKNILFRFLFAWLLCTFSAGAVQDRGTVASSTEQGHAADNQGPSFPPTDPADEEWEDDEEDEEFVIDKSKGARDGLVFLAAFYSLLGLMFAWAARKDKEFDEEEKAKTRAKAEEDKKANDEDEEYEEVWTVAEKFGHGREN
ncbi:MAG: hypothetical protein AAF471_03505 [Myxococcota bacterium]